MSYPGLGKDHVSSLKILPTKQRVNNAVILVYCALIIEKIECNLVNLPTCQWKHCLRFMSVRKQHFDVQCSAILRFLSHNLMFQVVRSFIFGWDHDFLVTKTDPKMYRYLKTGKTTGRVVDYTSYGESRDVHKDSARYLFTLTTHYRNPLQCS